MRQRSRLRDSQSSEQLAFVFQEVVRDQTATSAQTPPTPEILEELRSRAADFAHRSRARSQAPEKMLIELKTLLKDQAPRNTSPERDALVSEVTEWVIAAYYEAR